MTCINRLLCLCDSAKDSFKSRLSSVSSEESVFTLDRLVVKKAFSGKMDVLLVGFVIQQILTFATCFPNGAPLSACVDMMPKHVGVQPQPTPAPYTINPSSTSFQTGNPLTGSQYRGVLLEARSGSDTKAIGTWQMPPANTKLLQCADNPQTAVTHANTEIKDNSTIYTWTPPATVSTVYFVATVAQQRTVYWLQVKSANLTKSDGGGASFNVHDSGEKLKVSVIPALLLSVLLANLPYLSE